MDTTTRNPRPASRMMGLIATGALVAAACTFGAATSPPSVPAPSGAATDAGGLGTPEKPAVTVGYRLPSLNSVAPLLIAQDKGYWEECGLESVELIQTEEVQAGVIGGSLDFGIVETVDAGDAQLNDLPLQIIAGFRPYTHNVIAVRPEITEPADLAGKDVLLGGTPGTRDYDVRVALLAEAGYDVSGVDFNAVSVEGGSDTWVALLEEGQLSMTPIFNRHYDRLKEAGMHFWVDRFDFGSDHIASNEGFIEANPNTSAAFLCGTIQGIQDFKDLSNMDYVLGLGEDIGIEINDGIRAAYELDVENYRPHDGGPGPYDEMQALFDENLEGSVDLQELLDLEALNRAQAHLGLTETPAP